MGGRTRVVLMLAVLLAVADIPNRTIRAAGQSPETGRAAKTNNLYVVQMAEFPVGSYPGGVAGLAPTKANRGQKIDPNSGSVIAYAGYLTGRHDQLLGQAGGRKV